MCVSAKSYRSLRQSRVLVWFQFYLIEGRGIDIAWTHVLFLKSLLSHRARFSLIIFIDAIILFLKKKKKNTSYEISSFRQPRLKSRPEDRSKKWFGTTGSRWKRWRKWRRKRRGFRRASGISRWEDAVLADPPPWYSEGHRRSLRSSLRKTPRNLIVARTRIHRDATEIATEIATCKNLFSFIDAYSHYARKGA